MPKAIPDEEVEDQVVAAAHANRVFRIFDHVLVNFITVGNDFTYCLYAQPQSTYAEFSLMAIGNFAERDILVAHLGVLGAIQAPPAPGMMMSEVRTLYGDRDTGIVTMLYI